MGAIVGRLVFACGAAYATEEPPDEAWRDRRGRYKVATYDTRGVKPPLLGEGERAPCLTACPARVRDSGRKQERAFWETPEEEEALRVSGGKPSGHVRFVVVCRGRWEPIPTPEPRR